MVMPTHVRTCAICQKTLSPTATFGFCNEHLQQFQRRQQEGVTTETLDARWGDTLDIWREHPSSLDEEIGRPSIRPLVFSMREQEWLLFTRSYPIPEAIMQQMRETHTLPRRTPRLSDMLAVNVASGAIRRFVSMPKEIVLEDLKGKRPASYQAELAPYWGNPDLGDLLEKWEQQFYDKPGRRINIPRLVAATETPIYGLVDHAAGFSLENFSTCGFSNYRVNYIGFLFSNSQHSEEQQHKFRLISGTSPSSYPADEDLKFLDTVVGYDHYEQLLRFYHLNIEQREQAGSPTIWEGDLAVGQQTFSGVIRYWSQPYKLYLFSLKEKETASSLHGSAVGLSFAELLHVFGILEIINEREDVLTQYQHERQD
jgi:hypothetical protein